ncbi:interleukin-10 [Conger conger]|uniref:interleukin-10 n=1 Tax=Conger conger TaxID=82655 RepID=UPI002A598AD5|nr:interleukin-10 [Conger conger]
MSLSWFVRLSVLLTALLLEPAHCMNNSTTDCKNFLENFPVRLKELRSDFDKIRRYYEDKDYIETPLLDENVLNDFQNPFGCHAINEVLRFYLDTVLPTAINEEVSTHYAKPINSIGSIFNQLKRKILYCRNYFSCKKPFELDNIMTTYKKMQGQGLYKAMGELGLLFNYIEEYMASVKPKH